MNRNSRGVSLLLQLAIAIGLLAILAAIFVPNFISSRGGSSLIPCKSNLKNIGTGLMMYSTDWNGRYPASLSQLSPNYLKSIPYCSAAGVDTYSDSYGLKAGMRVDQVSCVGTHSSQDVADVCSRKQKSLRSTLAEKSPPSDLAKSPNEAEVSCPEGGVYRYQPYTQSYLVFCKGDNHKRHGLEPNFPQFNPEDELLLE